MIHTPKKQAGAVCLLALLIFAGGVLTVLSRYEGRIAESHARAEQFYRKAIANDAIASQTVSLRRERARALADLRHVSKQADVALSIADLIEAVQADARRFGLTVTAIEPQSAPLRASRDALQQSAVTVKLRGHFTPLLRFVCDLPQHATLVDISDTQISLAPVVQKRRLSPLLDAVVHATLFRLDGHRVPTV